MQSANEPRKESISVCPISKTPENARVEENDSQKTESVDNSRKEADGIQSLDRVSFQIYLGFHT
jgi:hypothetical protein